MNAAAQARIAPVPVIAELSAAPLPQACAIIRTRSVFLRRMSVLIVHCSCPDAETAASIAHRLVDERLAACVQVIPGVISTYRWEDRMHADAEVLLLIKTTRARFDALKSRLPALHPYESPELIAVDAVDGLDRYLDWVETETAPE